MLPLAYLLVAYLPVAYLLVAYLPVAYLLVAYLPVAYLLAAYLHVAYLLVAYWLVAYLLVALLGDSLFGGSARMAASYRVLLSPSTYIGLGVFIMEVTRGRLPWLSPFICTLLTLAHELPALLSIGTYPPL